MRASALRKEARSRLLQFLAQFLGPQFLAHGASATNSDAPNFPKDFRMKLR
jgi:hypothetical protein